MWCFSMASKVYTTLYPSKPLTTNETSTLKQPRFKLSLKTFNYQQNLNSKDNQGLNYNLSLKTFHYQGNLTLKQYKCNVW